MPRNAPTSPPPRPPRLRNHQLMLATCAIFFCLSQFVIGLFLLHRIDPPNKLFQSIERIAATTKTRDLPVATIVTKRLTPPSTKKCSGPTESGRFLQANEITPNTTNFHQWLLFRTAYIYGFGEIPREKGAINFCDADGTGIAVYGYPYVPPDIASFDQNRTLWERRGRFPSVERRIRFYMGRWYRGGEAHRGLFGEEFDRNITAYKERMDLLTWPDIARFPLIDFLGNSPRRVYDCHFGGDTAVHPACGGDEFYKGLFQHYVFDYIALALLSNTTRGKAPILSHFFDGTTGVDVDIITNDKGGVWNESYPVFAKVRDEIAEKFGVRHEASPDCRMCGVRHSSIIWPFNVKHHLPPIAKVPTVDIPWEEKVSKLVWRGKGHTALEFPETVTMLPIHYSSFKKRMALVKNHLRSKLVDAKFTVQNDHIPVDCTDTMGMTMKQQLQYKYIMAIEGNDISTGLKWMLFSNSLLFSPLPFTFSSWAMEPMLEPWVHFIPVHSNMTNVEEMVLWAEDNPVTAKQIAQRGTLFVYDLFFHPDAYEDEEQIMEGMMQRYQDNFGVDR